MIQGEGLIPSPEVRRLVNESMTPCADMNPKDFTDWERFLIPANDPRNWLRKEYQRRNDCDANSGTTGLEVVLKRLRGILEELARTWAYQETEIVDRKFGFDTGASIPGIIEVFRKKGCPTEAIYPYANYTTNRRRYDSLQTAALLADAATRKLGGAILAPAFDTMRVHTALGNPGHWGHWWPLPFQNETIAPGVTGRVVRGYRRRHGGSLHATEIVWTITTPNGEPMLVVANSHNDGYFYVPQAEYEEMRDPSYNPCGAYVLMGAADPVVQYTGQIPFMGTGR